MQRNLKLALILAFSIFSTVQISRAAGVTIITHGYSGDVNGWITGMASQMTNYPGFPGTNSTTYTITLTTDGTLNPDGTPTIYYQWSRVAGPMPTNTFSGEIIVKLDWSQMAGGLSELYDISTYNVAVAASWIFLQTNSIPDLGGHALVEFPIHMIGHSRGGSLVNEISRILGTNGVWVDHLTTLDPHPFNNDGNTDLFYPTDASANKTYVNVLFRDNYWQNIGVLFDPDGEQVNGAYNRQLQNLSGGYNNTSSLSPNHSNVHLWYHGTLDFDNPATDGDPSNPYITTTERYNWWDSYEDYGINAGFLYSRIGRGDRTSSVQPEGVGYPAIRDGYNQAWDLGAGVSGNRTLLPATYNAWPDVIKFDLTSTNPAQQGTNITVKVSYQWSQPNSSNATLSVYLDNDFNPLNTNQTMIGQFLAPGTGLSGSISLNNSVNITLNATNAPAGSHALYAKITGGGNTRYLYAPEIIQVLPAIIITTQPTNQTVWAGANVTFSLTVAGVPTLQYQWLKNGAKITGATNTIYTTNNVTLNMAGTYSCLVSNAFGNATSSNAVLTVLVPDTTNPTNTIITPISGQRWSNAVFNVTGTAGDNVLVANVWYQINGLGWNLATTGNNWSNWTAQATLTPGTNTVAAYSVDTSGNCSLTNSVSFQYVVTNQLQVFITGVGTILPINYNNSWLEIGRNYSMTATPGTGFMFTNWTGNLTTSAATLNFTMASNLVFVANFIDTNNPVFSITNLTAGQRWSNAAFIVRGTAGDNWQVTNVWYQFNGLAWSSAATANGWTNWSATLNLVPGTNSLQAYAVDSRGNVSATTNLSFQFVMTNQLQICATGLGTVSPNYSNAWLEIGRNYSITSAPASGFVFTNWLVSTNWIGGTTTTKTNLTFMMASNLTLQANFIDTNRPVLSITNLVTGQRWSNAVFTAKGWATDNWQVASVQVQLNGGIWANATGMTNWSTPLTLTPGTNTLAAYATDTTGNISPTNSLSFQFVVTNQLLIRITGLGTNSPNYSNAWLEIGRNYSITSAPASGFVFTNWLVSTNWIGGASVTGTNLQFMMASNLTLQANFLDVTKPTISITNPPPPGGQHMTNALATFAGTASDNWKVTAVWYQLTNAILPGGTWSLATTTNGYTNWTATVTLAVGTNTIKAYAVDLGGNYSATNNLSVLSSNTFLLQLAFTNAAPLKTNGLVFNLQLSTGLNGRIQVSSNLTSWDVLTNFTGTNSMLIFRDPAATNSSHRFYRAVIP